MKLIFQLLGFALVIVVLLCSVLFYMETLGLLQGDFGEFIHVMHALWLQAKNTVLTFMQDSGIANDAANLLDQGADMLRTTASPSFDPMQQATPTPTLQPNAAPTQIILPALTPQPTATPQFIIISTPVP